MRGTSQVLLSSIQTTSTLTTRGRGAHMPSSYLGLGPGRQFNSYFTILGPLLSTPRCLDVSKFQLHFCDPLWTGSIVSSLYSSYLSFSNFTNILKSYFYWITNYRNCIGSRLVYLLVKMCIAEVVRNFKILKTPRTPQKLELDVKSPRGRVKGGIWVKMEKRD